MSTATSPRTCLGRSSVPRRGVRPRGVALALALLLSVACDSVVGPDGEITPVARPDTVRGVYVNAVAAGSPSQLANLIALADGSSINTFVIDVKERGDVSYASEVALVDEIGANRGHIPDLPDLLRTLREHGIYPIARIVCFLDPVLAEARPDLAIRTSGGDPWLDPDSNRPWVDPYNAEVQAYNIDLAREALAAGFAEIQWDYVRFPDMADSVRATLVFPAQDSRPATDAIRDFIATSRTELAQFDAPVTADVFGRVITLESDSTIGQSWDQLVRVTDVLLPMVYPALYWAGDFGVPDPNADPYPVVRAAMDSAVVRMARTSGARATLRPWLQAFTLGSTTYGPVQMLEQIRAVEDAGLTEWLFWHPDSQYPAGVF